MNRFVDTSVFCGYWPFRCLQHRTPETLKAHLRQGGVCQAWVAAAEAVLYPDPMQANEPLFEAIDGDPFFVPVAVIDVTLGTWRRDARQCLDRWGCRALKLVPNYHQVDLGDPRVAELVATAGEADVPVCIQLRMMDERSHHSLMRVPGVAADDVVALARQRPDVRFLACGAYLGDLATLAEAPNVWAEISLVESGQALASAVAAMGSERLVFASHSPFLYFDAVAAKLDVDPADVPPEQIARIRERNAATLLGTPRSRSEERG